MKKSLILILALVVVVALSACGGNTGNTGTVSTVETGGDVAETGVENIEKVEVGNKISTDFIEMTITEASIENSVKTSIENGNITYTFGPDDSSETDFAVIRGKITNKSTSKVNDNIVAMVGAGEYKLEEDDFYVYTSEGDTTWELSPLVEYNFMLCVEIPNTLIDSMDNFDFNFGFKEGLASSSSDFSNLDYKYALSIANIKAE